MKKTPWYRRRLVVNWSLQVRYAVLLAVLSAFFSMVLGYFALRAYAEAVEAPGQMALPFAIVGGWGLAFTFAATTFGLVISNRWAGPLFRMERYLQQISEGLLPVIHPPRKGDELHGLFAKFKAASESLRIRQERELEALESTLRLLARPDAGISPESLTELRSLVDQKRASLASTEPVPTAQGSVAGPTIPSA